MAFVFDYRNRKHLLALIGTIFVLAVIPLTAYLVSRSEENAKNPKAATVTNTIDQLINTRPDHANPHAVHLPLPMYDWSWGQHGTEDNKSRSSAGSINLWLAMLYDQSNINHNPNVKLNIRRMYGYSLNASTWTKIYDGLPTWYVSTPDTGGGYVDVTPTKEADGSYSFQVPMNLMMHMSTPAPGLQIPASQGVISAVEARLLGTATDIAASKLALSAGADYRDTSGSGGSIQQSGFGQGGLLTGDWQVYDMVSSTLTDAQLSASPPPGFVTSTTDNPPTVSITAPTNGSSVTVGTTVTVNATATDTDTTPVSTVRFSVDGTVVATDNASPYTYNWNTTGLSGTHTISVTSTDTANNLSNPVSVSVAVNPVTIDNPPTVAIASPASSSSVNAGTTVNISATATDTDTTPVASVKFSVDSSVVATDTVSPYTYTWNTTGLSGTHSISVVATDTAGKTSTTSSISITVNTSSNSSLPAPWVTSDVGSVGVTGATSYSNGTFTTTGSGADVWNSADAFRYAYQTLSGDGYIIAKINSQTAPDPWAKAGIMIRESTAASSTYAYMAITPSNGSVFQYRTTTGANAAPDGYGLSFTLPLWVKVQRGGNTFTGYTSADGVNFTQAGTITMTMAPSTLVGLAVTSHNNAVTSTAAFNNVSVGKAVTTSLTMFEAETMSISTGQYIDSSGNIFTDSTASGGKGIVLYSNGSDFKSINAVGTQITVRAKGDQCKGAPHMIVTVDNNVVLQTYVSQTTWSDFTASANLARGTHTVTVSFDNDYYGGRKSGCDRNLRLDKITLQ